ncbi:MAG: translation initiation factor 2B subunit (eIF-2B alpha/beta/delta family) [Verrucomicrobiales bacterium]|jgi:translation initiation factor 2B subunit (eIF-2B alpha/beta/delta family)
MNSETPTPDPLQPPAGPTGGELEVIESRLTHLEHALLDADAPEASLGHRIESLADDATEDSRKPAEKLNEVAQIARECAKAIDQLERRVIDIDEPAAAQRQQLLADRVGELREQVYQSLRSIQESRQNESQQELVATLATLLDSSQRPLPKPSAN